MFRYAQLDEKNVVVGISDLIGEVTTENMVLIKGLEIELGSVYDSETNTFTPPVPVPVEPQPALEEQIDRLREDNLILMDALATAFEEVILLREDIKGGTV